MPPIEITPAFIAVTAFAAFLVGLSKGGLPVVAMLSVPILALFMPPLEAAALLLPLYIASDMVGVVIYRRNYSARNLAILVPASMIGILFGWASAAVVPDRLIAFLIGMIGIVFTLDIVRKRGRKALPPRPADVPRGVFWGSLAGFTSFVSHSGGPPYQVYVLPQRLEKMVFAGTSTILFAAINLAKFPAYLSLGQFTGPNLTLAAWLVPVSVLGVLAGWKLVKVLPEAIFFRIVEVALFLVSAKLVVDAVRG